MLRTVIPAAILGLSAGVAHGQSPANTSADNGLHVTVNEEADEAGFIGRIVHHNRLTMGMQGEQFFEFETPRGVVILRLDTTLNNACEGVNAHGCPDTLSVWELPEGIMASALEVETPELETSVIDLFEWTGM